MLYERPNNGNRILPSVYTRLRDVWLRANRVLQPIDTMNQGHINASINLLNESHVNLVDRMSLILGKMHAHLHNRPDLQARIIALFHDIEKLNVDDFYPIVKVLANHLEPINDLDINDLDINLTWDER